MAEAVEGVLGRLTPLTGLESSLQASMQRLSRIASKADPIRRT